MQTVANRSEGTECGMFAKLPPCSLMRACLLASAPLDGATRYRRRRSPPWRTVLHIASYALRAVSQVSASAAGDDLTIAKAVLLGVVEGVTEYLPISSTGHLLVTERLIDVGQTS